ncbi:hypothetical protein N7519_011068 [Penicillium mononematosum]|uniref:uncharacterized protein n=1 Tax=Penicillium mononematosum TaxID=268346 RepID=UPI0025493771|nr:uncharacterized protein N7519_011068 [Penicillium mononematosum]KAJ6180607.1 hypothetical protein N7519_011068 [Penicillium mononematosum]
MGLFTLFATFSAMMAAVETVSIASNSPYGSARRSSASLVASDGKNHPEFDRYGRSKRDAYSNIALYAGGCDPGTPRALCDILRHVTQPAIACVQLYTDARRCDLLYNVHNKRIEPSGNGNLQPK